MSEINHMKEFLKQIIDEGKCHEFNINSVLEIKNFIKENKLDVSKKEDMDLIKINFSNG